MSYLVVDRVALDQPQAMQLINVNDHVLLGSLKSDHQMLVVDGVRHIDSHIFHLNLVQERAIRVDHLQSGHLHFAVDLLEHDEDFVFRDKIYGMIDWIQLLEQGRQVDQALLEVVVEMDYFGYNIHSVGAVVVQVADEGHVYFTVALGEHNAHFGIRIRNKLTTN